MSPAVPIRPIAIVTGAALLTLIVFVAGRPPDHTAGHAPGHASGHTARPAPLAAATTERPVTVATVAQRLVRQLNDPRLTDGDRAALLHAVVAPDAPDLLGTFTPGPGFEQATGLDADAAARRPLVAAVVPVQADVRSQTANAARVAVWAVSVVGTRRLGQLVASWSTETLDLHNADGRWLLVNYRSTPGPVPVSTQPPTPVATVLAALAETPDS